MLEQAIKQTTGLVLPVQQVALEEPPEGQQANSEVRLIQEEDLPQFRALCREKIEAAARDGMLLENPHLLSILFKWKYWNGLQAARQWAAETVGDPAKAVLLLQQFVQVSSMHGLEDYAVRTRSYIDLRELETFVDVEAVTRSLASVDAATLSGQGSRALRCFTRALQRRMEGKPDDPHALRLSEDEWD